MYRAISMIGVPRGLNKHWVSIVPNSQLVRDLFINYRRVFVELSLNDSLITVWLDLDKLRPTHQNYAASVVNLLIEHGEASLPTQTTAPALEVRTAKFSDAHRARYHVQPVHPQHGLNAHPEDRSALRLTREDPVTDYITLRNNALFTVNGFYHMADTDGQNGVLLYEAGKSYQKCKQNQVGILSFYNVAAISCIPITPTMVHKRLSPEMIAGTVPVEPYSKEAFIQVSQDLTNKTVFLVLGGYLHTSESTTFSRVADQEFRVDFQNYPLIDRFYESSQYMDLSSLGLSTTNRNYSQISVQELTSDPVLVKYLTLSQSFLVIIDHPELFANRLHIKKTHMAGMYVSYREPMYPIVTGLGRMPEYWSVKEDGQWSLTVHDDVIRPRLYNTTNPLQLASLHDATITDPIDPEIQNPVYFLEIGRDIKRPI